MKSVSDRDALLGECRNLIYSEYARGSIGRPFLRPLSDFFRLIGRYPLIESGLLIIDCSPSRMSNFVSFFGHSFCGFQLAKQIVTKLRISDAVGDFLQYLQLLPNAYAVVDNLSQAVVEQCQFAKDEAVYYLYLAPCGHELAQGGVRERYERSL